MHSRATLMLSQAILLVSDPTYPVLLRMYLHPSRCAAVLHTCAKNVLRRIDGGGNPVEQSAIG